MSIVKKKKRNSAVLWPEGYLYTYTTITGSGRMVELNSTVGAGLIFACTAIH